MKCNGGSPFRCFYLAGHETWAAAVSYHYPLTLKFLGSMFMQLSELRSSLGKYEDRDCSAHIHSHACDMWRR